MKILASLVIVLVYLTSGGLARSATLRINTRHREVDGGSDTVALKSPLQWTGVESNKWKEEEEMNDKTARLREAIIKAMQSNR